MGESEADSKTEASPGLADALNSICGSAGLRRSARLQRFLRYVVQQAISAPDKPLKEIQIALDVFDRRPGFDPQIDPIVRVEAGRLRLRLTEYYAGSGQKDKVLIELGKGGYLPTFRSNPSKSYAGENHTAARTSAYRLYLKGHILGQADRRKLGKGGGLLPKSQCHGSSLLTRLFGPGGLQPGLRNV